MKTKKRMFANVGKRILAFILTFAMVFSVNGLSNVADVWAAENEYAGNLLVNPDFNDCTKTGNSASINSGWVTYGGGGQHNNPHDAGGFGFYLNGGDTRYIKQTITIPYTGLYNASVYLNTGKAGARFGVRHTDGTVIAEYTTESTSYYTSPVTLPTFRMNQGDEVEIYVYSINSSWVNGDDFSLTYDFSAVTENLLNGVDFSESSSVDVRIPWDAGYKLSATVAATEETTVKLGTASVTVATGETKEITLKTSENLTANDMLNVSVEGTAAISDAVLKFDPESIPNAAPVASNVTASGNLYSGETLKGSYDFSDADEGQKEGSSLYRWLLADEQDGTYTAIEGQTASSLLLTTDYDLKWVKFEVTPVDSYGKAGTPVVSDVIGQIHTNLVNNPSMEEATANFFNPDGWVSDGAGFVNDVNKAYDGLRGGEIGSGAELYTVITAPKNGNYTFTVMVNTAGNGGSAGIRMKGASEPVKYVDITATTGWQMFTVSDVALEKDVEVEVYVSGGTNSSKVYADKFAVIYQGDDDVPEFTTLKHFSVEKQAIVKRDEDKKTIEVTVPYGTDVTALTVSATVSDEAAITPASGEKVDFTNPVVFKITNGSTTTQWTVTVKVANKTVTLESDNATLVDGFTWAANKMQQFIIEDGKQGYINDRYNPSGPVSYFAGYICSYAHETAFCTRDFSHMSAAGALTGLWQENKNMLTSIAESIIESRGYWQPFGFNFDGSPCTSSFYSEATFLRELPADFETIEKAYQTYLWTGDKTYINDETFLNWYENKLTTFVEEHDSNDNGVCESTGPEGALTLGSYNERSSRPLLESGDAFGSQYQATLAYAGILEARGETDKAAEWYQKAADLKEYFNKEWGGTEGNYIHSYTKDGKTYNDFSKETTWFIAYKELAEGNERTDKFLQFIADSVGDGIGDTSYSPNNIEAYTYLPDAFFNYNEADTAWKYMQYILSVKDNPHEIAVQGTNGNYPEISFTFVSHTITGMMGVEPNAPENAVSTVARLPQDVGYVKASGIQMGTHELDVKHDGLTESSMTNHSEDDLTWTVQFYGDYDYIVANGQVYKAEKSDINGDAISYAVVTVAAGATVDAAAYTTEDDAVAAAVEEVMAMIDAIGEVTLESEDAIEAAREVYDALSEEAKALVENLDVLEAAEAALAKLKEDAEVVDNPFVDIDEDDYYYDAVIWAYKNGITTGIDETHFSPEDDTTRAQAVTFLWRSLGCPEPESDSCPFVDVKANEYYYDAVLWAYENGITKGTDATHFSPEADVTRAQFVTFLWRLEDEPEATGENVFVDVNEKEYYYDAILWAYENEVTTGTDETHFCPDCLCERAQVVTFFYRMCN